MQKETVWSSSFIMICITNFFLFMTFYTQVAALPIYVKDNFSHNATEIGLVLTLFVAGSVLSRFFAGQLMSQLGHKRILLLALLLFLLVNVLYLFSDNYVLLLVLRFVHGISFGITTSTAATFAAELTPPKRMGTGMGYYGMFMSLAMVIGPFIGLTIVQHSTFQSLFILCIACSVFGLLSAVLVKHTRITSTKQVNAKFTWSKLIEPKAVPISITAFTLALAYSGISAFASVYGQNLGLFHITNFFFAVFALLVVMPRPILGRLFDSRGENVVMYPGMAIFLIGICFLSDVHGGIAFLASAGLIGLGYGVLFPGLQALSVASISSHRRGFAMSTYLLFFDAGTGIGSIVLGLIAGQSGFRTMYVTCAVIVAIMAALYYLLHHRRKNAYLQQVQA